MNDQKDKKFDLEQRCKDFFAKVIKLCKKIPINAITKRQVEQLIGAAGSIGANWFEASESESKKDFVHKVKISRKEAKESQLWLYGLGESCDQLEDECHDLIAEAREFVYIFTSMINKIKS
ncbi:four helix bundle protein [Candidatus Shapirobacteria bacterium CG09_land_8_20_14_0_10_49_15]|uniref:Four helix bundle protein n=1 Tax=Candidatus Shapirobacteria bacterium CG09_land_8_20_14_0_10_49_15 TaxID=1974482 RepID=A0A2M6XAS8_9BACT|nr:MAG: four helix bundle protein [Candidatus Shapirobacteria bacterium CG09_land_8_20_14_0_10_49_15]